MSYEKSAILNQESSIYPPYYMVGLVTKKSEGCYLSCVACGGYMERKTCNVIVLTSVTSVQYFDSPSN
jgi:hypothetical protein